MTSLTSRSAGCDNICEIYLQQPSGLSYADCVTSSLRRERGGGEGGAELGEIVGGEGGYVCFLT